MPQAWSKGQILETVRDLSDWCFVIILLESINSVLRSLRISVLPLILPLFAADPTCFLLGAQVDAAFDDTRNLSHIVWLDINPTPIDPATGSFAYSARTVCISQRTQNSRALCLRETNEMGIDLKQFIDPIYYFSIILFEESIPGHMTTVVIASDGDDVHEHAEAIMHCWRVCFIIPCIQWAMHQLYRLHAKHSTMNAGYN